MNNSPLPGSEFNPADRIEEVVRQPFVEDHFFSKILSETLLHIPGNGSRDQAFLLILQSGKNLTLPGIPGAANRAGPAFFEREGVLTKRIMNKPDDSPIL